MKVVEELIQWAETLQPWQSDAVRRIWVNGVVKESDAAELFQICRAEHGLGSTEIKVQRFGRDHVASGTVHQQVTILKSLLPKKNVNAIASDSPLSFQPKGITVVYGENAAGKSGFSRILKRACRARGATTPIYPNVFDPKASKEPAEAEIIVAINDGPDISIAWNDRAKPPECLANIAVFDSQTARLYIDEANDVRYIPYGLDVFSQLAGLCQTFKSKLTGEIAAIPNSPDILNEIVGEDRPISAIEVETTSEIIDQNTCFTDSDEKHLDELKRRLAQIIAHDPTKESAGWKRLLQRIQLLGSILIELRENCSVDTARAIQDRWHELRDAKQAAELAARETFSNEPVKGTGTETWRILFDAARHFSESVAYPETPFPSIGDESRCLLCQQPLSDEAKTRLTRFWQFIRQDVSSVVQVKSQALAAILNHLKAVPSIVARVDVSLVDELDDYQKGASATLKATLDSYSQRYDQITAHLKDGLWEQLITTPETAITELDLIQALCKERITKCEAATNPEERVACEREIKQFERKQLAFKSRPILKDHLKNIQLKKKLSDCIRAVDTTGITRKGSSLMERALTGELREALQNECAKLGAKDIPLQVTKTGSFGNTFHRVILKDSEVDPSIVLSEGEQRVVALASFLAELGTSDHGCGIVFDDPVSSLDHLYREKVATRLAAEGLRRQVIIFTHDLFFLFAIMRESKIAGIECLVKTVRKIGNRCGISSESVPWIAMKTTRRIGALRNMHQELKKRYDQGHHDEYAHAISDCYGLLRETWERAIEEVLFQDCIRRFEPAIQTQQLKNVTVTADDYKAIENGMTKCSAWIRGHDRSVAANSPVPGPDELLVDINELDNFVKIINKRTGGSTVVAEQRAKSSSGSGLPARVAIIKPDK